MIESLLADDTTICGNTREMRIGIAEMVRVMECFEEKCHPEKEEELRFGEESAEKIRMLGVFIGRGVDMEERLKRMRKSSFMACSRDTKFLQRYVDKLCRYVWSDKKKQPLREMQEKKVNMFQVGKDLGVGSLEMKIEKRTLERIGHVLRIKNDRIVKQITLG